MLLVPQSARSGTQVALGCPRLHLLGPMRAEWGDGGSFLPRNAKTQAVLAVLALADTKPVPRDLLMNLLWPTRGREQAQASLRQSIHELRGLLTPLAGAGLRSENGHLTLRMEHVWIDAILVQSPAFLAPHLPDVLRGPLLGDLFGLSKPFDAWIAGERSRLSERIAPKLQSFLATAPDDNTAINTAEAIISYDPSHEAAWKTLAKAHAAAGNSDAALDVYHRCLTAARKSDGSPAFDMKIVLAACLPAQTPEADPTARIAHHQPHSGLLRKPGLKTAFANPFHAACIAMAPTRAVGNATPEFALCVDWQLQSALCKFEDLSCAPLDFSHGNSVSPQNLAAEGFDFLLEGCMDRTGNQVQLILRLRDLHWKGEVFWSQRIFRPVIDAGLFDADFATSLAPQIVAEISKHQATVLENATGKEIDAAALVIRASRAAQLLEKEGLAQADKLLSAAIGRDPRQPALLAWAAYVQLLQLGQGWLSEVEAPQRRIGELIDKSLSLNPQQASVLSIAGHVLAFTQNRLSEGLSLQEKALSKNPNLPSAWLFSGLAHTYAGEHKEAISRLQHAKRLSPADQQAYFIETGLSLSHLFDGDTESALTASRNAIRLNPNFSSSFKAGVSAAGYIDAERARSRLLQRLLLLEPGLTVERVLSRAPLTQHADKTRLADGLRLAGLPK